MTPNDKIILYFVLLLLAFAILMDTILWRMKKWKQNKNRESVKSAI